MGGFSDSTAQSEQDAYQSITQQYMGICDFSCTNNMSNVTIVAEDSTINGIDISQACNVDGNCMLASTTDANASVFFSAQNSTSANDAGGWLDPLNVDVSSASSYQDMRQQISQAVQQKAQFSTTNNMDNIVVYAARSTIGGTGIEISQAGDTSGSATLSNMMQGMANSTGMTTNDAQSGKKAMNVGQWAELAGIALGVIIIIVIIVGVVHYFIKSSKTIPPSGKPTKVTVQPATTPSVITGGREGNITLNFSLGPEKETAVERALREKTAMPKVTRGYPATRRIKDLERFAGNRSRLENTVMGRIVLSRLAKLKKAAKEKTAKSHKTTSPPATTSSATAVPSTTATTKPISVST